MKVYRNWIIIGGTGRNIGKTTLVGKLIRKFSAEVPVTALKMSNIREDDNAFHGHDVSGFESKIRLEEETRMDGNKDSMRFLKAGAKKSWFIQTRDEYLTETFPEIEKILRSATCGICESNSLHAFFRPGLFIMVKGEQIPPKTSILLQKADEVVTALDDRAFDNLIDRIVFENGGFSLRGESGKH